MMNASEPTTGEIVRALRCDGDANNCVDCRYATYDTATILCDQEQNVRDAADRLESQEQAIEELKSEAIVNALENAERIANLTARAEQAEAFIKCAECKNLTILNTESVYAKCHKRGIAFFPFDIDTRRMGCMDGKRGLPQEGEDI